MYRYLKNQKSDRTFFKQGFRRKVLMQAVMGFQLGEGVASHNLSVFSQWREKQLNPELLKDFLLILLKEETLLPSTHTHIHTSDPKFSTSLDTKSGSCSSILTLTSCR